MRALDTPEEIHQLQLKIILAKSKRERFFMGVDMIDMTYNLVKNTILEKNPNINKGELIAKIFHRYYQDDFPPAELEKIMFAIKKAHIFQKK